MNILDTRNSITNYQHDNTFADMHTQKYYTSYIELWVLNHILMYLYTFPIPYCSYIRTRLANNV